GRHVNLCCSRLAYASKLLSQLTQVKSRNDLIIPDTMLILFLLGGGPEGDRTTTGGITEDESRDFGGFISTSGSSIDRLLDVEGPCFNFIAISDSSSGSPLGIVKF
ncbi:hypothetical protein PFISCL1PPCAC_16049, partial [Pristionchus fissidentatus]